MLEARDDTSVSPHTALGLFERVERVVTARRQRPQ
jgi:hypothetical protein